jgi:UDP-N-acetylmuramoyl-tripeptide--D-alanyl-D-alanine ligase
MHLIDPYLVTVVLALLVALWWGGVRCVHALHMLQLDSYANARLLKWLWTGPSDRLLDRRVSALLLGLMVVQALGWVFAVGYIPYVVLGVWGVAGGILVLRRRNPPAKKALVYTARARRILSLAVVLEVVAAVGFGFFVIGPSAPYAGALFVLTASFVLVHLAPFAVLLANLMLEPVQWAINQTYLVAAKQRLRQYNPRVVGITGSYGKTSTKYFLHTLLRERYCTLKTPQSFNTLMGICRVVNGELQPQHEVFIVEMGAYRRGDIRELCNFVPPHIGILTAIGPQHLERFKTLENIATTKYELITSLPQSGVAVFNNDDPRCRALADRTTGLKVLRYGVDTSQPGLTLWAEEIVPDCHGQAFTLVASHGQRVATHTALLGRHNVLNMLGAACVALELGIPLEEIAQAIPKIEPAPHRLQLLAGAGGVTVIDDSYNSNPIGAAEALATLREFKTGKRVLVTPGMVELGAMEAEQNERFGAQAAGVCDYVLLVGPRQTQAILKGLQREHFPSERIRLVKNLTEATAELQRIVQAGDVVLFENDLPDLYAEA